MSTPTVSILVPTYNREDFIVECVESALAQSFEDFEVVICDNLSTDGSWALLQELSARSDKVRIFRNDENLGPVENWRRCMTEARGKFGKLLFSDDTMTSDFLERSLPFLDDPTVGFVLTGATNGPTPAQAKKVRCSPLAGLIASADYLDAIVIRNSFTVSPGAGLFRLADLRKNLTSNIPAQVDMGFSQHGAGPDVLLYLLTALDYEQVAVIPDPLAFFRAHEGSITDSDRVGRIRRAYVHTRIWFAESKLSERQATHVRARCWLEDMNIRRSWLPPGPYLQQFSAKPADATFVRLSLQELAGHGARRLGLKSGRR